MNSLYSIEWTASDNKEFFSILKKDYSEIIKVLNNFSKSNKLPILDTLNSFNSKTKSRPEGSRRAFYVKSKNSKSVVAVKGTEILSSQLKNSMIIDQKKKLLNRPWTKFENFIYREQKPPLAMLFNEAKNEAAIGSEYQHSCYNSFKFFDEAPVPLIVFKWKKQIVKKYISIIKPFLDHRAQDLLFPLIQHYGLGGIVYWYPYLPTRIRFQKTKLYFSNKNLNVNQKLKAFNNLIDIQARMLLAGYLPFSFEDHGIGQCIAPQNVTMKGGICDLGSIKAYNKSLGQEDLYIILRSIGGILTRTVYELFGSSLKDIVYEFENPTTIQHQISAIVHEKMRQSLKLQSIKYSISLSKDLKTYYESDDNSLKLSLGLLK